MTYVFDKNYNNDDQVAEFLPAFLEVYASITERGEYTYNNSFRSLIPGIEGDDEDTAIYLLQGLKRKREQDARVESLLTEGYAWVNALDAITKYDHIVLVPQGRMSGEWSEYRESRLIPQNGTPWGILPKGKRSQGYLVSGRRVLAA